MNIVKVLTAVLTIVGGVNWGLVGALDIDLVAKIFGVATVLSKVVYIAVGISAVAQLYYLLKK